MCTFRNFLCSQKGDNTSLNAFKLNHGNKTKTIIASTYKTDISAMLCFLFENRRERERNRESEI